ncbi:Thioredoxin-like fold,Glutathione S-transferase, N-terminal,Glutathione S-transferase, C-terminal- [Cinara cedri]|uniref:Thioredoxin-like fold,Glutathione S-transferase, N-terminal,Glutathione S-transferase, C-terminal n=1 Tax=Cinara cedri TaxID=506608 RepID=A0A5E4N5R1_9HEMI|nr:Thioredoxin-like fold,Glutathione S-transferase, N-terminal,Glutathione S-transferase, C-terminal- [Cinara cedri]
MPIDFYYTPGSAPCRAVLLAAKSLDLELNLKPLDLHHGEHLKPEFVKLNPQHCVPTLVDGDLVLWESRAIIVYLVQVYGKDDSLFPKDPKKQAVINQRLQFDLGTLYPAFADQYYPWIFAGVPKTDEKEKKIHDALAFLEIFLASSDWAAGDNVTVADLALVASISTFESVDVELKKYANISKWLEKCKATLPGYEVNQKGADGFRNMVDNLTKK